MPKKQDPAKKAKKMADEALNKLGTEADEFIKNPAKYVSDTGEQAKQKAKEFQKNPKVSGFLKKAKAGLAAVKKRAKKGMASAHKRADKTNKKK